MRFQVCVILSSLILSSSAMAASQECRSGSGGQGYRAGYNLQKGVIEYLWENQFHGECSEIESFVEAVNVSFDPDNYGGSGYYLQCRDEGLISGLTSAIEDIQESCGSRCVESGGTAGELFAKQYCGVVEVQFTGEAADMVKSIDVCETFSRQACRASFLGFVNTRSACKDKSEKDPDFNRFLSETACPEG